MTYIFFSHLLKRGMPLMSDISNVYFIPDLLDLGQIRYGRQIRCCSYELQIIWLFHHTEPIYLWVNTEIAAESFWNSPIYSIFRTWFSIWFLFKINLYNILTEWTLICKNKTKIQPTCLSNKLCKYQNKVKSNKPILKTNLYTFTFLHDKYFDHIF